MASLTDVASGARTFLRDFPLFFEADQGPLNTLTIRLPHPLIDDSTLAVYTSTVADPPVATITDKWQLDARNGLLKITDPALLDKRMLISGYHFSWFLDSDLAFHAAQILSEITYSGTLTLDSMTPAHTEVMMLGTIVHALWSLQMELMLDIDVSTPEGMFIPARQRYTQVMQMMQYFEGEYESKASMLNMGLGALEIFRLRRVSYMTGRYVPVYRDREYDDHHPPDRLYPPIPWGVPPEPQSAIEAITGVNIPTVEEIAREGQDFGFGGWRPVGWSGSP